jgi:hypothetical protein
MGGSNVRIGEVRAHSTQQNISHINEAIAFLPRRGIFQGQKFSVPITISSTEAVNSFRFSFGTEKEHAKISKITFNETLWSCSPVVNNLGDSGAITCTRRSIGRPVKSTSLLRNITLCSAEFIRNADSRVEGKTHIDVVVHNLAYVDGSSHPQIEPQRVKVFDRSGLRHGPGFIFMERDKTVGLLAHAVNSELFNTAVFDGVSVETAIHVFKISSADSTLKSVTPLNCTFNENAEALRVNSDCSKVFLRGDENGGGRLHLTLYYDESNISLQFLVWYPRIPIQMNIVAKEIK